MLNYEKVKNWKSEAVQHTYDEKDVILYALSVGMGQDPQNESALHFVTENELRVLPSMATVLATPGFWMRDHPELEIDCIHLVHGEQKVTLYQPLPAGGSVIGQTRVTRVVDKGISKGALVYSERQLTNSSTTELIATCESMTFCRADGGFSAKGGGSDQPLATPDATPERTPEQFLEFQTRTESALLYRLSGDLNPLHSDPKVAKSAGFPRPILHGLATYGGACSALLNAYCENMPIRLTSMYARFSSPTFPGDRITLECWDEGTHIAFRAKVLERNAVVLSHGRAICTNNS